MILFASVKPYFLEIKKLSEQDNISAIETTIIPILNPNKPPAISENPVLGMAGIITLVKRKAQMPIGAQRPINWIFSFTIFRSNFCRRIIATITMVNRVNLFIVFCIFKPIGFFCRNEITTLFFANIK